jgi:uncharacterized protein YifN (PemK superfamily)
MAIHHNPKPGALLRCDFTLYAQPREPEMVKHRPVVVLSRPTNGMCIVVPLSTKEPVVIKAWHHEMDHSRWPPNLQNQCWAKCDVILTVADWRLDRYYRRDQYGKRKFQPFSSTEADFAAITAAVVAAMGFLLDSLDQDADDSVEPLGD